MGVRGGGKGWTLGWGWTRASVKGSATECLFKASGAATDSSPRVDKAARVKKRETKWQQKSNSRSRNL